MNQPFDIGELRANIGEDAATERRLFTAFIDSVEESAEFLARNLPARNNEEYNHQWKRHAHRIKGAALNICAACLTEIASEAERQHIADIATKKVLLESLVAEFGLIKAYIRQIA